MHAFRYTVEQIRHRRDRVLIQLLYLTAARTSEVITKVDAYDALHHKSKAYGQHISLKVYDFTHKPKNNIHKVLVIELATAKRKATRGTFVPRLIALPCHPAYEPWTVELLKWHRDTGVLSFPISRRWVHKIVKKHLRALDPNVHPHRLRFWRLTHLVTEYAFDGHEVTAVAGWTQQTGFNRAGIQSSPQLDVYLHVQWRNYFSKLLKPIAVSSSAEVAEDSLINS
jgi:hypothetical protein